MRLRERESGFVLVMVLLALAVCGTILASAARRSARGALAAAAAQRDLQLRWGALSCRDAVLGRADDLMLASADPAALELESAPQLGGMTFRLILSDEQAKANVNHIPGGENYGVLEAHVRRLEADAPEILTVQLRPLAGDEAAQRYASFDQIFALHRPDALFADDGAGPVLRRRITCWGDGKVNLRRAEIPVMREALEGNLTESQMNALVEFRRTSPDFLLDDAFAELGLSQDRIAALDALVTDESSCYSLWMSVESKARRWRRLYVTDNSAEGSEPVNWVFSW